MPSSTPKDRPIRLPDRSLGDKKPIAIKTTVKGTAKNPSSARAVGWDPGWPTDGTATAQGTTNYYIIDSNLTGTNDKWNGLPIEIHAGTETYNTRISDWSIGTSTLQLLSQLPTAVSTGHTYRIAGEPLLPIAAATVSSNTTTVNTTEALHAYSGRRRLAIEFTFSATEIEWVDFEYDVIP